MLWQLKYAEGWEQTRRGAEELLAQGLPLPDWYQEPVTVRDELMGFWNAFWILSSERYWSEGFPKAIPWSKVKDYAEYEGYNFRHLFKLIRSLDATWLKHVQDEHKAKTDRGQRAAPRPPAPRQRPAPRGRVRR